MNKKEDKPTIEKITVERDTGYIKIFVDEKVILTVDQKLFFNGEDESDIGVEISNLLNKLLDEVLGYE